MGTGVTDAEPIEADAPTGSSFDEVFRREHARVVRLVYALTRSNDVAQDVAQEAFARLLEHWPTVANPEGFVRTTAVNRVRDRERHRIVRRRVLRSIERDEPASSELDYLADALAELRPSAGPWWCSGSTSSEPSTRSPRSSACVPGP